MMAQNRVTALPTALNVEAAWEEYRALAAELDSVPGRRTDLAFCQSVARAWKRWLDLFLEVDRAA